MGVLSGKIPKDERLVAFLNYDYSEIADFTTEDRDAVKMSLITMVSVIFFNAVFVAATWISPSLINLRKFFILWAIITTVIVLTLVAKIRRISTSNDSFSRFRVETIMHITVIVGLESIVIPLTTFFNPTATGIKIAFIMVVLRWLLLTPVYITIINSEIINGNYQNGLQEKKDRIICKYRFIAASICILKSILGPVVIYICLLIVMGTYMRPIYLQHLKWKYAKEYSMTENIRND